jgi:Tol biopolymer transport system component
VHEIAFIGADGQVYVAQEDGSAARCMTRQVSGQSSPDPWSYRWPTYSPNGRRLAFAGYHSRSGQLPSAAVASAEIEGDTPRVLLESPQLAPIYLYWGPDNRRLSVLLQRGTDLELHLLDADGVEPARLLLVGQPLYWSWASDTRSLAIHLGGDARASEAAWLGQLRIDESDPQPERYVERPGAFRAPAWAPSGDRLAYVVIDGEQSMLCVRDASGHISRLAASSTEIAFIWAPTGDWIAFATASPSGPQVYQGLQIVRPDGGDTRLLTSAPLVSFFWSPDARRIALLGLDPGTQSLAWSTVRLDGQGLRPLATFVPTREFAFQLPFFDQYAQSTSVWSADGAKLVYAAQGGGERRNGASTADSVIVLDVDGHSAPLAVARGSAAVWAPAPHE